MYVDFVKIYQKGEGDEEFQALSNAKPEPASQVRYLIYPNPSKDEIRITGPATPLQITLFNLAGQKLKIFNRTNICNISDLPKGIYLARISAENGVVETVQWIKE